MPRQFSTGSGSHDITLATGGLGFAVYGTIAGIVKRGGTGGWNSILQIGGNRALEIEPGTGNRLYGWNIGGYAPTITVSTTDNWVLLAVTKVPGTNTPRFHKYVFDTNTYTAENAGGTAVDGSAGSGAVIGNSGGDVFQGDMAVVGSWDYALSDEQIKGLAHSLQNWYASAPKGLWLLDQASTSMPVLDATGNGANQTGINGTAVSTQSQPAISYGFAPSKRVAVPSPGARLIQTASLMRFGATNPTLAFDAPVQAGSLIVATASPYNQKVTAAAWSVGGTASPSLAVKEETGTEDYLYVYYSWNATAGAHTVQFTQPSADVYLTVSEWAGIKADGDPLDQTATGTGTGTAIATSSTAALAQAGELVLGLAWHDSNTGQTVQANPTAPAPPDFRNLQQGLENSSAQAFTFAEGRSTTTAAVQAKWTRSVSGNWKAAVATFKEATPAAAPPEMRVFNGVLIRNNSGNTATGSVTPTSTDSILVAGFAAGGTPSTSMTVSDSVDGPWTPFANGQAYGSHSQRMFWKRPTTTAARTVTFTGPGGTSIPGGGVVEVSGVDALTPMVAGEYAQATGTSTSPSAGTLAVAGPRALVNFVSTDDGILGYSPGAGWTEEFTEEAGNQYITYSLFDRLATASGSYSHTATQSGSQPWGSMLVALQPATAGPAPAFRSANTAGEGSVTSISVNVPTGTADGDLLLAHFYLEDTSLAVAAPAGWQLASVNNQVGSSPDYRSALYWKRASGESGSYTWSWSGFTWAGLCVAAFSGVATTGRAWETLTATVNANQNDPPTAAGLTTTGANRLLVGVFVSFDGANTTWGAGSSGMTGRVTTGARSHAIFTETIAAAGATGSRTVSCTGGVNPEWHTGYLLDLLPPPVLPITFVNVTSSTGLSPALPTGTTTDDVVLAIYSGESTAATVTAPSADWTVIQSDTNSGGNAGVMQHRTWWARKTASALSTTWTDGGAGGRVCLITYRGCRTTGSPINATSYGEVNGKPLVMPSITTTVDGCVPVALVNLFNWSTIDGTDFTYERLDQGEAVGIYEDGPLYPAGATGTMSVTSAGSGVFGGTLVALEPPSTTVATAITHVDSAVHAAFGGGVTSLSFNWGTVTGEADGDIAFAYIYRESTAAYTATPSGWTQVTGFPVDVDTGGFHYRADLWWRRRSGDTGTATWSWSGAVWAGLVGSVYRGAYGTGDPIATITLDEEAAQNNQPANPGLTLARANSALINFVWNFTGTTATPPTGYAERLDANAWVFDKLAAGSGATGSVTATLGDAEYAFSALIELASEAPAAVPQHLVPDADQSAGTWTTDSGGTTNLYQTIDEQPTASDADYIQSVAGPSAAAADFTLTDGADPLSSTGHTVRVRALIDAAIGGAMTLTTELRQGASALSTPATWDDTLTASAQTFEHTLSGGQADAITDYANLRLRFTATQAIGALPTFVAHGTAAFTATNAATIAPGLPSGWAAGDIHILVAGRGDNTAMTSLSGWTQLLAANSTTAWRTEVWWRRAVGGDTAPTVTFGSSTIVRGARIYGVRGCATSGSPFDTGAGAPTILANAAAATVSFTNLTTQGANRFILAVGAYEDDPTTVTTITNYTQPSGAVAGSTLGNDMMLFEEYRQLAAAGSAGSGNVTVSGGTFTNSPSCGVLIALLPVAAGSRARVTWTEVEVPPGAGTTYNITPSGAIGTIVGTLVKRDAKPLTGAVATLVGTELVQAQRRGLAGLIASGQLTGALSDQMQKRLTAGGTATATATVAKVFPRSVSGSAGTPAGTLVKQDRKPLLAGALTPAGALLAGRLLPRSFTGAVATIVGTLLKRIGTPRTGAITPGAGTLAVSKVKISTLTGAITPAGALVQRAVRAFAGTVTQAGVLVKRLGDPRSGAITPAGALLKATTRALSGALTPAATLVPTKVKLLALTGVLTPGAGTLARGLSRLFAGALTPAGALTKRVTRALTGALTPGAGTLSVLRIRVVALAGSLTPTGTLVQRATETLAGAISPTGTLAKRGARSLTGAVTSAGSLRLALARLFAGAITPAGALLKRNTQPDLAGSVTPTGAGTFNRGVIPLSFAGSLASAGAFARSAARAFTGAVASTANVLKSKPVTLAGSQTQAGALVRQDRLSRAGSVTPGPGAVSLVRVTLLAFTGSVASAGALVRRIGKTLSGALTPAGSLTKRTVAAFAGAILPTGTRVGRLARSVAGTVASAGTVAAVRLKALAFAGSGGSPAGAYADLPKLSRAGALAPAGTRTGRTSWRATATVASLGSVVRYATATLSGAISAITGNLTTLLTGPAPPVLGPLGVAVSGAYRRVATALDASRRRVVSAANARRGVRIP